MKVAAADVLLPVMLVKHMLAFSFSLLVSAHALPAMAQEDDPAMRSAGRKLALDGVALFQQGKPAEASQKLEKAYQLLQVPSIALWSARALEQRGLLVEASERYVEAARLTGFKGDKDVQLQAQKDAARELEKLLPRIPSLVILLAHGAEPSPVVTLDGKAVPPALLGEEQPVNPGAHQIKVSLGTQQTERQVALKEGEKKRETIDLDASSATSAAAASQVTNTPSTPSAPASTNPPADTGASSSRKTLAYVALAAGGAGIALGSVTGVLALGKRGSLEDNSNCRGDVCLPSQRGDVDSLNTLRTVSSIGFIAGGVLATTGLVLILTGRSETNTAGRASPLALRLTPRSVSLAGGW